MNLACDMQEGKEMRPKSKMSKMGKGLECQGESLEFPSTGIGEPLKVV